MNARLEQAIDGVYDAFRDIPRPTVIDGCPCCIDRKNICNLLSKPLRAIAPDDLGPYASSAFLTVGDTADYLYFLPRILDVLANESGWWPDVEVVARCLNAAGFHTWPEYQRMAVSRYFDEAFEDALSADRSSFELDDWVCALGRLHVDLTPFLARIVAHPRRLIDFYETNSVQIGKGRLSNAFWEDAPVEQQRVIEWFRSPEIQQAIELAYIDRAN